MLIYCFCLCSFFFYLFFLFLFCSVKMFWDVSKRINWSAIWVQSRRACFVFGYRIIIPEGPPLSSAHQAEWHSTAGRYGSRSKHLHLPAALWLTHNTGGWPQIPDCHRKTQFALCRPGQSNGEKSKVENSLLSFAAACLLTTLCAFFCIFVMGCDHVSDQTRKRHFAIYF